MKKIVSILLFFVCSLNFKSHAQGTTAIGIHVGLSAVYYKTIIPNTQSQVTTFLPHFNAEVKRSGENVFYGSLGIGVVPRRIPFYTFDNGNKIGIEAAEGYAFVKTGIQARSSFLTHLPYLSLGISRLMDARSYYANSKVYSSIDTTDYNAYFQFKPYIEIGNTLLNSTYVEDKRNILVTLSFRYYPTHVFRENFIYALDFNDIRKANYNLFDIILTMGIQHNFHHQQ